MIHRNVPATSGPDNHWVEVGRKGTRNVLSVQMMTLPSDNDSVMFRIMNRKNGVVVVEPWILHQDLINMLYSGLSILKNRQEQLTRYKHR